MRVTLDSTFGDFNYRGTNERGQTVHFSGSKQAVSAMETVLMACAACSAYDIESILKKMRQPFTKIKVTVDGKRADDIPAVFTEITLHYIIYGDVDQSKAKKAVDMSINQYCSVSQMIAKTAEIKYTYEIISE